MVSGLTILQWLEKVYFFERLAEAALEPYSKHFGLKKHCPFALSLSKGRTEHISHGTPVHGSTGSPRTGVGFFFARVTETYSIRDQR